eukprot:8240929-Pyramimonas_sp.AAC.1
MGRQLIDHSRPPVAIQLISKAQHWKWRILKNCPSAHDLQATLGWPPSGRSSPPGCEGRVEPLSYCWS